MKIGAFLGRLEVIGDSKDFFVPILLCGMILLSCKHIINTYVFQQ